MSADHKDTVSVPKQQLGLLLLSWRQFNKLMQTENPTDAQKITENMLLLSITSQLNRLELSMDAEEKQVALASAQTLMTQLFGEQDGMQL